MCINLPVTLVIPILNEAESLPDLLKAIQGQSHRPDEIIFSDAGSTDESISIIEEWGTREQMEGVMCHVLSIPGAMPGAGRNAGVLAARNDWIAFLDGGIVPASDWLEHLCKYALKHHVPAVFGVCHFSAQATFTKAVCALSYGHGASHPVVPASLFARKVFDEAGYFSEKLRAGEDVVWMKAMEETFGERDICKLASVQYGYFPTQWKQAFQKWKTFQSHSVQGGIKARQHLIYFLGIPALYLFAVFGGTAGGTTFLLYLILRGFVDPIRRSVDRPWWKGRPMAALIAVPLAATLDIAKFLGLIQGLWLRFIVVSQLKF